VFEVNEDGVQAHGWNCSKKSNVFIVKLEMVLKRSDKQFKIVIVHCLDKYVSLFDLLSLTALKEAKRHFALKLYFRNQNMISVFNLI
jgi:hypothetical protein